MYLKIGASITVCLLLSACVQSNAVRQARPLVIEQMRGVELSISGIPPILIVGEEVIPTCMRVLAIDGGGIRGIVPAIILAEIEKRTKKPATELFDLIVGTSTGAILTLAITKPDITYHKPAYSAEDIVKLYEEHGAEIFSKTPFMPFWLKNILSLFRPMYSNDPLERILGQYLGETYLDEALTRVMVISYDIERRKPYFFRNYNEWHTWTNMDGGSTGRYFLMKDAALASSAAPTYFPPVKLLFSANNTWGLEGKNYLSLIDGGVYANNPAFYAWAEANGIYRSNNEILLVSLGNGRATTSYSYRDAQHWGRLEWASPLVNIVFGEATEQSYKQLGLSKTFFRFTADIENDSLDDASASNIRSLKAAAYAMVKEEDSQLSRVAAHLMSPKSPRCAITPFAGRGDETIYQNPEYDQ